MIAAFIPTSAFAIDPDDNKLLPEIAFGIYVATAGDVVYEDLRGNQWKDTVAAGGTILMSVRKVLKTNTTATGLRGYRREF